MLSATGQLPAIQVKKDGILDNTELSAFAWPRHSSSLVWTHLHREASDFRARRRRDDQKLGEFERKCALTRTRFFVRRARK